MSFTLARWDSGNSSSAGWWLIRELPGVGVYRPSPRMAWKVVLVGRDALTRRVARVWGDEYEMSLDQRFLDQHPQLSVGFRTRNEALLALQLAIDAEPPAPAELSLVRWNDLRGNSAGAWLVRELSGWGLVRSEEGWEIRRVSAWRVAMHDSTSLSPGYDQLLAQQLGKAHLLAPGPFYPTREAALQALQSAVDQLQARSTPSELAAKLVD